MQTAEVRILIKMSPDTRRTAHVTDWYIRHYCGIQERAKWVDAIKTNRRMLQAARY